MSSHGLTHANHFGKSHLHIDFYLCVLFYLFIYFLTLLYNCLQYVRKASAKVWVLMQLVVEKRAFLMRLCKHKPIALFSGLKTCTCSLQQQTLHDNNSNSDYYYINNNISHYYYFIMIMHLFF